MAGQTRAKVHIRPHAPGCGRTFARNPRWIATARPLRARAGALSLGIREKPHRLLPSLRPWCSSARGREHWREGDWPGGGGVPWAPGGRIDILLPTASGTRCIQQGSLNSERITPASGSVPGRSKRPWLCSRGYGPRRAPSILIFPRIGQTRALRTPSGFSPGERRTIRPPRTPMARSSRRRVRLRILQCERYT